MGSLPWYLNWRLHPLVSFVSITDVIHLSHGFNRHGLHRTWTSRQTISWTINHLRFSGELHWAQIRRICGKEPKTQHSTTAAESRMKTWNSQELQICNSSDRLSTYNHFSHPSKFIIEFFKTEICVTQNSIFFIAAERSCAYLWVHGLPQSIILLLFKSNFFNHWWKIIFPPICVLCGVDMRKNESNLSLKAFFFSFIGINMDITNHNWTSLMAMALSQFKLINY